MTKATSDTDKAKVIGERHPTLGHKQATSIKQRQSAKKTFMKLQQIRTLYKKNENRKCLLKIMKKKKFSGKSHSTLGTF